MAVGMFKHVKIGGISIALPNQGFDTEELAKDMSERELKRFIKSTGVKRRYIASKAQTTSDLCYVAATKMLDKLDIAKEEIDACIFVSQNEDYNRPATAIILQARLGLQTQCMCFDITLGCSGYVYGIYVLAGLIEGGAIKKALLLAGDVNKDLEGELLFGDGGTATLLEYSEKESIINGLVKSDGSGFKAIYTPVGGQRNPFDEQNPDWENAKPKMNGADVFEFTITQVPEMIQEFNSVFKTSWDNYDYVILHQANKMMLKHIINKLEIPEEKAPFSIQDYANVSSASVPIGIADLCEKLGYEDKELSLLLSGFGVGLSLGVISMNVNPKNVLPIAFTDYVWDEVLEEKSDE